MSCVVELFHGDVVNACLVMSSGKRCLEEFVETQATCLLADETTWEYNDVGIVVLADEMSNLRFPNQAGTDALVLVEGHGDAFTAAAHGNTGGYFSFLNAFGQCMAIGGVVAAVLRVGSVVLVFYALLLKVCLDKLLEREGRMVTGKSDHTTALS